MTVTQKTKDEFNLKENTIVKPPIDCSASDKGIAEKFTITETIMSPLYLMIKKCDGFLFNRLPPTFGDEYETSNNPCLSQQQADLINKKRAMQRQAITFILQLLLIFGCLMHLFFFTNDILGADVLPKLLCSFLVLFDPVLYIGILIILFYIKKFKPANELHEEYVIGIIDQIKKPIQRKLPMFDKYILFLSKEVKSSPSKILEYFHKINK